MAEDDDVIEAARRAMVAELNTERPREELEAQYGRVWTTADLAADFHVEGFLAPFVLVQRKSDNARGSLMFQRLPRFYFGFKVK